MINNRLNKAFSVFLSVIMLFTVVRIDAFAAETDLGNKNNVSETSQGETNKPGGEREVTDREVKIFKLGFGTAIGIAVVSALVYAPFNQLSSSIQCGISERQRKLQFEQDFPMHQDSEHTPHKQGVFWDWAACAEGLLKIRGITVTQKNIVKKLFSGYEIFKSNRQQDIGTRIIHDMQLRVQWEKMLSKMAPGLHFRQTFVVLNDEPNTNDVKNYILNYYGTIGRQPFAIVDSYYYGGEPYAHFVNITQIDDNDRMTIEDPETGLKRTENIENFCSRYKKTDGTAIFSALQMFTFSNRDDIPVFLNRPIEIPAE